jgi:hypothetical protein
VFVAHGPRKKLPSHLGTCHHQNSPLIGLGGQLGKQATGGTNVPSGGGSWMAATCGMPTLTSYLHQDRGCMEGSSAVARDRFVGCATSDVLACTS